MCVRSVCVCSLCVRMCAVCLCNGQCVVCVDVHVCSVVPGYATLVLFFPHPAVEWGPGINWGSSPPSCNIDGYWRSSCYCVCYCVLSCMSVIGVYMQCSSHTDSTFHVLHTVECR